jgi:anti-anti-sigma regulatory factor
MSSQLSLPDNMTIHNISEVFNDLKLTVSSEQDKLIIDCSALEMIDTSGLQALLVLKSDLVSRDVEFGWQNVNETLSTAAQNIGLSEALDL